MKFLNKSRYCIDRILSQQGVRTTAFILLLFTSNGCKKGSESRDIDFIQEFEIRILKSGEQILNPVNTASALRIKSNSGSYPTWSLFQDPSTYRERYSADVSLFIYKGAENIYSGRMQYSGNYPYSANASNWKLFNPDGTMILHDPFYDSTLQTVLRRIDIQFDNADSSTYYSGLYRLIIDP
jgi:hypothetical protein